MTHEMNLHDAPFRMIKNGTKTIEMRLYDEKRRKIVKGDNIKFVNRVTGEIIYVEVTNLYLYESFEELYKHFTKSEIGYEENENANPEDMKQYYNEDEIKELGVVGIEIKLI